MSPTEVAGLPPGSPVFVRRAGSPEWVEARLDLRSGNGESILVSAPEGLGGAGRGFALLGDRRGMRMVLMLSWRDAGCYFDVNTGLAWAVKQGAASGT